MLSRGSFALATACIALLAIAGAAGAKTSVDRHYVDQVKLRQPEGVFVNPVTNHVLVSDVSKSELLELDAYPSNKVLDVKESKGAWGGSQQLHAIAESTANEFLYTGSEMEELLSGGGGSGGIFTIFDDFEQIYIEDREGNSISFQIAVDNNPTSDSYGTVYVYEENRIYKYDGYGNPVPFQGSASYIEGNEVTGTPFGGLSSGGFQPENSGIAVDAEGDIWVTNREPTEIDEFDSSGAFKQRITAASSGTPEFVSPGGVVRPFGYYPGLGSLAIDPTNQNVVVSERANNLIVEFTPDGKYLGTIDGSETPLKHFGVRCQGEPSNPYCVNHVIGLSFNTDGYLYVGDGFGNALDIFSPLPVQPAIANEPDTNATATSATFNAEVDPDGGGAVTSCKFEYREVGTAPKAVPCVPDPSGTSFTSPTKVHADVGGLTAEKHYEYRVTAANANAARSGAWGLFTPHKVLGLRPEAATEITVSSAKLNASFIGNGAPTNYWFEYGTTPNYGKRLPLPAPPGAPPISPSGPGRTTISMSISGLKPVTRYHFRIVAQNGSTSKSDDGSFRTPAPLPEVKEWVSNVHSSQVDLHTEVNPGGTDTAYNFEYGTEPCSNSGSECKLVSVNNAHIGSNTDFHPGVKVASGLEGGKTYYYRVLATSASGTQYGPDRSFSTYRFDPELKDGCANQLARQQTGAALLTDCRAYELVSSPHAGGYDVESNLVPNQEPFEGHPRATGPTRVLYGVHSGAIPGVPGNPTNRGVDPYIATRGESGWTTSYVGIPATNPNSKGPFSSALIGTDPALDVFAFGGPSICSPCFPDESTGIPVRLQDGELVQGMQGTKSQPKGTADGLVKKTFSDDGNHFVFSSTSQFADAGNNGTGDVSIYDRNLDAGTIQVVSTDGSGSPLSCLQGAGTCHAPGDGDGIAELDMSADGSRILVGQRVSTDSAGNGYYRLYMHQGTTAASIPLTPGAAAIYDGMTADGSHVFVTTTDHLVGADTDNSADIYEIAIDGTTATPRLLSTKGGSASNDDSCQPPGEPNSWNSVSGNGHCNAVAFSGGSGIAADAGTFYFVSPELLDSAAEADGEAGQANLYVVDQGGDPEFVAVLDSKKNKAEPLPDKYTLGAPSTLIAGLNNPASIAVDQNSGDIYVAEAGGGMISRWHADGTPAKFASRPDNKLPGGFVGGAGEIQVAVDSSNSALKGTIYAATNGSEVKAFDQAGEEIGALGGFSEACGVAVDQSNGDVYVGNYATEVRRFSPISATPTPISKSNYSEATGIEATNQELCNIDVSTEEHLYVWPYYGGQVKQYNTSVFSDENPAVNGKSVGGGGSVQSDPGNGDFFIDEGDGITRFNSAGKKVEAFGTGGALDTSRAVAVDSGAEAVYAGSGGNSIVVIKAGKVPYHPIDNAAITHGVFDSGTHHWGDFQVTPDGRFAAFPTSQPIDEGFANEGFDEVYRYERDGSRLDCVSCPPTNARATGDASLASGGLSLADDGRVFFDTLEPIVLRDGDNTIDVYEWEQEGDGPAAGGCDASNPNLFPSGNCLSLISSGTSQFDSKLLTATADGTDAYFFTHDTLAKEDENGPIAKIYDARTEGGFFAVPPRALCVASDECHGPGTETPPPAAIRTKGGTPANTTNKKCVKGKVKKHGKCVKPKKKKKSKKHHSKKGGGSR
jgi:sugar lactone lactonase YvrE